MRSKSWLSVESSSSFSSRSMSSRSFFVLGQGGDIRVPQVHVRAGLVQKVDGFIRQEAVV